MRDNAGIAGSRAAFGRTAHTWPAAGGPEYGRQRYTKQFVDAADRFTLSFYGPEHKAALGVLGSKSGRDTPKVAEVGFTPMPVDGTMAFEEASLVLVCRKLYADDIKPASFIDKSCDTDMYPEHDYHTMYIAEVEKVLVRD